MATDTPIAPGISSPTGWSAPMGTGPLDATVTLPGSKSLTNRAFVLAALSSTPSRISGALRARDSSLMIEALSGLGVSIVEEPRATAQGGVADWLVTPEDLTGASVECGLAGTVMRFVPPVAALAFGASVFDGDPHARTRPMAALLDGLRQAGVTVDGGPTLPFTVRGTGSVPGGTVRIDSSGSSQFVSALLLAGARYDGGIDVEHVGASVPSRTHVEMTLAALREAGVDAQALGPTRWRVGPGPISAPDAVIEPDLSNAAPFVAAALVCGGSVTIPRWPTRTTQAGDALRDLLTRMGAHVAFGPDGLTVTGSGQVAPLVADLHDVSELTPVVAAICALAQGESRLSGVAHIRGHETDRLAALRIELTGLGGDVTETDDGLVIGPATLHGGGWRAYADHRMAQAGAVVGLAVPGVVVDDIASTSKTMADFPGLWSGLLEQVAGG